MAQRLQRPQLREALRQPLRQQAVRLHLRKVPRRATDSGRTASRRSSPPQSPGPAARRPPAQRRPPGTGWARGRGRWQPVAPAAHHVHADVQRVLLAGRCARLRLKGGSLGLRAYSMTPEATRLSRLVGCALSLSVFSLWQSPHSACRVCTLPQRPASPAPQAPPVSPQPHRPSCAARVFCLSALQEDLVRQAGQALAPVLLPQRLNPHLGARRRP